MTHLVKQKNAPNEKIKTVLDTARDKESQIQLANNPKARAGKRKIK